jgi:hypothetical protein
MDRLKQMFNMDNKKPEKKKLSEESLKQVDQALEKVKADFVRQLEKKGVKGPLADLAWKCKMKVEFLGKSREEIAAQLLDQTALLERPKTPVRDTSGELRAKRENEAARIRAMHHNLSNLSALTAEIIEKLSVSSGSKKSLSESQGAKQLSSSSSHNTLMLEADVVADYLLWTKALGKGKGSSDKQKEKRASILSTIPVSDRKRVSTLLDAIDAEEGPH